MNNITATEVLLSAEKVRQLNREHIERFVERQVDWYSEAYCLLALGFYRPCNRSPKRLQRLKHSLTMQALNGLPTIHERQ